MSEEQELKTIQFKRNPGTTGPNTSDLAIGEPAIAMDGPSGANSKIYIGIADTVDGTTDSVVAIGGGYYTGFVDALVTGGVVNTFNGATGDVEILDGVLSFNGATGAIEGVNNVNGLTGNVTLVDLVGVSTFNGATGDVVHVGVDTVNGLTGNVTLVDLVGVSTFNGATGDVVHVGVDTVNGLTGAVTLNLNNLDDVATSLLGNNVILIYDSASSLWKTGQLGGIGVSSFNGLSGAVEGVSNVNGITGAVTILDGVLSFNGATGSVIGVNSVAGLTGAVTLTQSNISDITATAAEINVMDASEAMLISIGLEGTDQFVVNDGGVMKQVSLASVANYIAITTLETFTVDDITFDGNTIGHTSDTDLITITGGLMTVAGDILCTDRLYCTDFTLSGDASFGTGGEIDFESVGAVLLPTLYDLRIDDIRIDGNTIGHTSDTDLITITGGLMTVAGNVIVDADLQVAGVIEQGGNPIDDIFAAQANNLSDLANASTSRTNLGVAIGSNVQAHSAVLDATTASFLTADETKLDAIEALADVTDATNVAAAGAAMISGVDFLDNEVAKPKLKDYSETVHAVGNVAASTAFDFEDGNVQTVTVSGIDTGSNIEFSLSNPPASGIAGTMTVIFTNGNAHGDHSFHSSIIWPGGVAPSLSALGVDIISFTTIDAGTTYYGFVGGIAFA